MLLPVKVVISVLIGILSDVDDVIRIRFHIRQIQIIFAEFLGELFSEVRERERRIS